VQLVTDGVHPGGRQMCLFGSQNVPDGQEPQLREPSQPSPIVPQYWPPRNVHDSFVQFGLPHMFGTFGPHVCPEGQPLLQLIDPLQPSPMTPQ
jgi:hypothetical protein